MSKAQVLAPLTDVPCHAKGQNVFGTVARLSLRRFSGYSLPLWKRGFGFIGVGDVDVAGRCFSQRHSQISVMPSIRIRTTRLAARPQIEQEPLALIHAVSAKPGETFESCSGGVVIFRRPCHG